MTTIQMQEAQTATSSIRSTINNQMDIIKNYTDFISQLQTNWSGAGYEAFVRTFNNISPTMRKMFDNMTDYNNQIIALLEEMQNTDTSSARLFDGV
jgi:WXG100 family type VII secretion target